MTDKEAKRLGIFTKWDSFSCQNCHNYAQIKDLESKSGLIMCRKCCEKIEGRERKQAQMQLFEQQQGLF